MARARAAASGKLTRQSVTAINADRAVAAFTRRGAVCYSIYSGMM
jgi:hypothetical protein